MSSACVGFSGAAAYITNRGRRAMAMNNQITRTTNEPLACQRCDERGPVCYRITSDTVMLVCSDCGELAIKVGIPAEWVH